MKDQTFPPVRRQDRLLDDARALDLLENSLYGFLSLGEENNGYAYGIPISYAYDREKNTLYFHCAPEGEKLDCLTRNPRVSFCVVGGVTTQPEKFTTLYESVIVFGTADLDPTDEERRTALRKLVAKYCPDHKTLGETYMERSFHRTQTFTLRIEHITAKCKR